MALAMGMPAGRLSPRLARVLSLSVCFTHLLSVLREEGRCHTLAHLGVNFREHGAFTAIRLLASRPLTEVHEIARGLPISLRLEYDVQIGG
jgi:hypothetical protein